jgi:hypothetical protein
MKGSVEHGVLGNNYNPARGYIELFLVILRVITDYGARWYLDGLVYDSTPDLTVPSDLNTLHEHGIFNLGIAVHPYIG